MTIKEMTDRAYRDIGKKTVNGFYALVGVITVGIYIFLKQKGYIQ
ncbi:hypothetical protein [Sulfuricurvum sp.]|nr:hypothetical protein [Sulfuricurvum sp.]